jgi:hypothetical protein
VEEALEAAPEPAPEPPAVPAVEEVLQAAPEATPEPPAVVEEVVQAAPGATPEPPAVTGSEEVLTTPPELPAPEAVPVPVAVSEESAGAGAGASAPEPPSEATPVPPPVSEVIEETEARGKLPSGEESVATSASGAELPPKPPLLASGTPLQPPTLQSGSSDATAEAADPLVVAATPTIGDPGETWPIGAAALRAPGTRAASEAAAQPGRVSCDQSVLAGPITDCAAGWLGSASRGPGAPVSLDGAAISWIGSSTVVSPSGDVHEDPAIGARPAAPVPGPAPGGASGVASGGGSGLALSAFLTLTGLLLLAAPRALRRLRLRCEPWLTAFFVLIPERPG